MAELPSQPNFPELEEEILAFWKKNKIFEKSIDNRPTDKPWTFLDGPPFITGLPHYGTLLSSIPKDVFPRFWTMKGYRVRRVWGWDCHGLPAENKVENKLDITRKKDIEEKIGIKKFIDECKLYVKDVSGEWEWYVDHIGRWVDFKNAYKTMDRDYMETVMWVFKQMYEKKYIYKGLRVSLYCPHCSTPISNFEVAMDADNYKDVKDLGTTYKYKLKDEENTYLLAWSTTPWNKIATPALAVNEKLDYVKVEVKSENGVEQYILAKTTLSILEGIPYKVLETFKGAKLIGKEFEPHYDFYKAEGGMKVWVVINGDFVTADEGTGIVTIAAYGEDDLKAMKENNIQTVLHVDEEGHIKKEVPLFGGMYYLKANKAVNEDLSKRGLVLKEEEHMHSMPHCWRCGTQLYYAPQDAWYVDVQQLKPQLFKNNEAVNWFPAHFKYGRFLKSMESAPDWCISRSRYWGSPVPVWECECGERFVAGSIQELENASGRKIDELHRPDIDDVIVKCAACGKDAHRVPEVLDSWIEAGSASFAERHFPFDSSQKLEDFFPPDFIVEYTGQIRAWFYVLHVLSTGLFDSHSFKNVLVTGVILGTDGRKMSKNFGNYPDPRMMLEKYGGDALRLYLLGSPVVRGEDLAISEEEYRNQIKVFHLTLWNIVKFYELFNEIDALSFEKNSDQIQSVNNILDEWILEVLNKLIKGVSVDLEQYDTMAAVDKLNAFIDEMSKWYVRRSRDRVGAAAENLEDKKAFYEVMYFVLSNFLKLSAPIAPFLSDTLYKFLTKAESVHLEDWPEAKNEINEELIQDMNTIRKLVEAGHRIRKETKIKVRQPLAHVELSLAKGVVIDKPENLDRAKNIIQDELNVKNCTVTSSNKDDFGAVFDTTISEELKIEGETRELVRLVQGERRKLNLSQGDSIVLTVPSFHKSMESYLMKKLSASRIETGPEIKVEKL